tara:strand:- start:933 stop:1481 length:549 start_codon:yes stop_codon:yes gene_type:complete
MQIDKKFIVNKTQPKPIVYVRLAKLKEAKLLYNIYNASIKAGYSNTKKLILYDKHIEWLKNKLISNSKIYIGKNSKKKDFGYVRFDETKNNIFEVSIANLPNFYGKGLGSIMLKKSINKFRKAYKPKKIICVIKKFNTRSYKCFYKNGFLKIKYNNKKHFTINKINSQKEYYLEQKVFNNSN